MCRGMGIVSSGDVLVLGTGNEIVLVEGLDGMKSLTELVLDRNKIKVGATYMSTALVTSHTSYSRPWRTALCCP